MKILIIEDDTLQSLNLKLHLGELGYHKVSVAKNLDELKVATHNSIYDLIFCDIHMPDADGIVLLSSYLKNQLSSGIIIVSAVDDTIRQLTMGMCRQLNYNYVSALAKPYNREQLAGEINFFISHQLNFQARTNKKLSFDIDLKTALTNNQFFPLYQPQFSFNTGELIGVEALVRLEHPTLGIIPPGEFLSKITDLGMMKDLYVFMLRKTTKAISLMNSSIHLSLNINQELLDWSLFENTVSICEQTGFPLNRLTLELTEEQAYNPTSTALENLARLSLYGVKFAIDDFGTGYASLEQLIDLPISELKIDRVFIARATRDYKHQQLTIAAIRLAHALGLQCVSEGVENAETWEYLKDLGVDICQGYYTGKPMMINELNALHYTAKKTKVKNTAKKSMKPIVLFDSQVVRANATARMLAKANEALEFITSTYVEQLRYFLRDLPVSIVLIDLESYLNLSDTEQDEVKMLLHDRETIILSNENNKEHIPFLATLIVKSEDVSKTSQMILQLIESKISKRKKSSQSMLSKREQDVAQLLLAGFSNKYIAYELDISQKTVSTFKTRIFQKLGIKSLIELAQAFNIS
ncbi:EAL domain-containing protein [Photobacterium leiognathi]|uniref:EAL domain-containing protein n=1 Tax=Photobacterium leiognathi TaxID=553611 RepID=UPI0029825FB6|nr:EAL domain-containing protein [Photobacterium leiognathi]